MKVSVDKEHLKERIDREIEWRGITSDAVLPSGWKRAWAGKHPPTGQEARKSKQEVCVCVCVWPERDSVLDLG